jgi:hypothetical protein
MSVHIGLNNISDHYGWDGRLRPCENDARDMERLAKGERFKTTLLRTRQATSRKVIAAIERAAAQLRHGDTFLLTYSGHGGQVPDGNGEEGDFQDETWCLWDRELVDDELYRLWGMFEAGVRIVVVSDSCHSGTVMKAVRRVRARKAGGITRVVKALPPEIEIKTYRKHKGMYDKIQRDNPKGDRAAVGASVILLSACQDEQEALAGYPNSLYTEKLLRAWNGGRFRGGYRAFRRAIARQITPEDEQYPNFDLAGISNPAFERQRPFTI